MVQSRQIVSEVTDIRHPRDRRSRVARALGYVTLGGSAAELAGSIGVDVEGFAERHAGSNPSSATGSRLGHFELMRMETPLSCAQGTMTDAGSPAPASRRDRLKQLRAFCEAVRLGSVSGAARAVHSSQPAVSAQLRALEEALGAVLFRRQGAGVAPTRVGANLYRIAHPLVEGLLRVPELFEEQHHGVASGSLCIGAGEVSGGSVLPEIVKRFQARYPRIRIEVRAGPGRERLGWLRAFEIDLMAGAVDPVPHDIAFHPLVETDAVLVTPEDHPLGARESVSFEALAGQRMVAQPVGRSVRHIQDVVLGLHGASPRIVLEVDDWGSMLNHVAAGVGIAIVPSVCVGPHEPVRTVRLSHPYRPRRWYGLAHRRDRLLSFAARRFVEVAVSEAAARDAG